MEALLTIAREKKALLIADEVMTGFGRTGPLFASECFAIKPDFIGLAKGITGGFLPLGATVCREEIFEAFQETPFFHGHSYTAGPLALTAAQASLDLLESPACTKARQKIAQSHQSFCQTTLPHVKLSSLGTILIAEYIKQENLYSSPFSRRLKRYFFENKVLVRPLGNILYIMPPYSTTTDDLKHIYTLIKESDGI